MPDDDLPAAPALGPDEELVRSEDWRRLGLPVPTDARGVLASTHGLLKAADDG